MRPFIQPIIFIEKNTSLLQDITPIISVIIAAIAIFISIYSICTQRRHNKNSIRPVGMIELIEEPDSVRINIVNKGLGPMLVKNFIARLEKNKKNDILAYFSKEDIDKLKFRFEKISKEHWLLPNEKINLFYFVANIHTAPNPTEREERKHTVYSILNNMTLSFESYDIYGDIQPVCSKTLVLENISKN